MAEKKIIWKQKTGESTYDILYPKTLSDNVAYGSGTVKDALDNIGTNLEDKFIPRTGGTVNGRLEFDVLLPDGAMIVTDTDSQDRKSMLMAAGLVAQSGIETTKSTSYFCEYIQVEDGIGHGAVRLGFPDVSGTLVTDGMLPEIEVLENGYGNAVTAIVASDHQLTVTKGATFATTDIATSSSNGLMSSTDKKNLDDMVKLFGTTAGDTDKVVNTVRELLALFDQYPEGTTITQALAGKADKTALNDYVTLGTDQTIKGKKIFEGAVEFNSLPVKFVGINYEIDMSPLFGMSVYSNSSLIDEAAHYQSGKISYEYEEDSFADLTFPKKSGTIALTSDLPASLPPSGNAGGDLTGTYPNPTIGSYKVTSDKIADGAVIEAKIGVNAVTTGKIKDGNVTNAKLDKTGVTAGSYSIVTVNAQGRVTAANQLFTIGTASVIPSTVMTSAFYLQEVA